MNKARSFPPSDFETYYKTIIIEQCGAVITWEAEAGGS
jgi:hypothetical protein